MPEIEEAIENVPDTDAQPEETEAASETEQEQAAKEDGA
jgi:hypothetical protein